MSEEKKKNNKLLDICTKYSFLVIIIIDTILLTLAGIVCKESVLITKKDLFQFCGTLLAFSSTLFLGLVSLRQNSLYKEENDRRFEEQQEHEHTRNRPYFIIKDDGNANIHNIVFIIRNINNNFATNFKLIDIKLCKDDKLIENVDGAMNINNIIHITCKEDKPNISAIFKKNINIPNSYYMLLLSYFDIYGKYIREIHRYDRESLESYMIERQEIDVCYKDVLQCPKIKW